MKCRFYGWLSLAVLLFATLAAWAQSNPQAELALRVRAAADAQQHGDAAAIAEANRHLAAFALAQLAELN
jgi:hypothetical protein